MAMDAHIASAYDRDLEAILAQIMKMGGKVEQAITDSVTALANSDLELAAKVRKKDKEIDALEETINEEAARLIALRAPMGTDLRTILTVIKVASALERVGDYAKNLAKRTHILAEQTPVSGANASIKRMATAVEGMLKDTLDAYVARDAKLAEEVRNRDQEVDQMYNTLFRVILTHMMEDPRRITTCMHLHFIAKNIERMGDHVTNIAEQVIYLATGSLPDEARDKGDFYTQE